MMRLLAATSLAAALLVGPAGAQSQAPSGNPAGMLPGTAQTAPATAAQRQLNQADRTFIETAGMGGMAEVALGKLAGQKGSSDAVKEFGRRMAADHAKANDQLTALAKQHNIAPQDGLDPEHREIHRRLESASGAAFDQAYLQSQLQDHQKTVQLFEYEIGSGQNAQLRSFAAETLPILHQHLQMAQGIEAQTSRLVSEASGAPGAPTTGSGSSMPARQDGGAGTEEKHRQ